MLSLFFSSHTSQGDDCLLRYWRDDVTIRSKRVSFIAKSKVSCSQLDSIFFQIAKNELPVRRPSRNGRFTVISLCKCHSRRDFEEDGDLFSRWIISNCNMYLLFTKITKYKGIVKQSNLKIWKKMLLFNQWTFFRKIRRQIVDYFVV